MSRLKRNNPNIMSWRNNRRTVDELGEDWLEGGSTPSLLRP
jgi:hypothetical protein